MKKYFQQLSINSHSGFSLIEIMVSISVLVILMSFISSFLSMTLKILKNSNTTKSSQQNARYCLDRISRDLESAIFEKKSAPKKDFQFLLNSNKFPQAIRCPDAAFWQTSAFDDSSDGDLYEVGYFIRWIEEDKDWKSVLCRFKLHPRNSEGLETIFSDSESWINSSYIDKVAPGDKNHNYRGVIAENVLGLWIHLYKRSHFSEESIQSPYDSRSSLETVFSAEVSIVFIDSTSQKMISDPNLITAHYSEKSAEKFVAKLPGPLRKSAKIFRNKIIFEAHN